MQFPHDIRAYLTLRLLRIKQQNPAFPLGKKP